MGVYKTAVLTHVDGEFISQWKSLWERSVSATIYNSYEWFLCFQEVKGVQAYEIFVCYQDDIPVAILPLQKSRCYGVSVLTTLLNPHLTDTPFLFEKYDQEVFKQFFKSFLTKNIFFQKIASDAAILLQKNFPQYFFSLISVNPVITMQPDPFAQASGSTIKQIKKILRQQQGVLRFEMKKNDLETHLKTVFAINEKSSKSLKGENIFSQKENRDFYRAIVKYRPDLVRICFLFFNDTPISYKYCYLYKKTLASDQIAFLNEYKNLSPGKTMTYLLLKQLEHTEIAQIDLGGGMSPHKTKFTNEYRLLYNLYYSPHAAVMLWWKAINTLRRVKQILFPNKNSQDSQFLFKTL